MYHNGQGVAQDYKQAVKWYRLAAQQGNAESQTKLGIMYTQGLGVTKDLRKAFTWYKKAAEQGNIQGQFVLGYMYAHSQGVTKDLVRAYMWSNLAVIGGYMDAEKNQDIYIEQMTSQQIEKAKKMILRCQAKNFKGCG
jgi:TPR repeat protein